MTWHRHPDPTIESLLGAGSAMQLRQALAHPVIGNDPYAVLRCLDRLVTLTPGDRALEVRWMQTMLMANRPDPVWRAILRRSQTPATDLRDDELMLAAQVAQAVGETAVARDCYHALLRQHPDSVDVWQKYVEFDSAKHYPDALPDVLLRMADAPRDDYEQEKALFALGHYWRHDEPQRAFAAVERAHALKHRRIGSWDRGAFAHKLRIDRARTPLPPVPGGGDRRPLFVVGLPRSGTTVLSSLLGAHDEIANAGEQNLLAVLAGGPCRAPIGDNAALRRFARSWYLAAVGDLAGDARAVIDKMPANAERAGLILELFPDALIVHIERSLPDCALSIWLHDFEYGQSYANRPDDLAGYAHALGDHLAAVAARAPDRFFRIGYEALVTDPRTVLDPVLRALGLDWQPDMLAFWKQGPQVATYSEAQVRQPLNRDAIDRWRRYLPAAEAFFERFVGVGEPRAG